MSAAQYGPLPTSLAADLDKVAPEAKWLVDVLWADSGVGLIGGTPKSYKSWLGLEIATAVATGTPCLGRFAVSRPGPSLVYLAEDALPNVRERLSALCRYRDRELTQAPVHVITAPSLRLDLEQDFRRLITTVEELQPRLLLLDPLVRLHRANENDAGEIAAILGRLRRLQRSLGVAIILVHHARKQGSARQPGQALRGSGDLHAWGDSNLYLVRDRHGMRLCVEHRAAPAPEPMYVRLAEGIPHLEVFEPDSAALPTLQERIVAELRRADKPLPRIHLRNRLAVNNKRLGDELQRLQALGVISRGPLGWVA